MGLWMRDSQRPTGLRTILSALILLAAISGSENETNVATTKTEAPAVSAGLNPCAAKTINPCAVKTMNPCSMKATAAAANPCNPCGGQRRAGVGQVEAAEMVNFCMLVPMEHSKHSLRLRRRREHTPKEA